MVLAVSRSRRREASGMIEGLAACFAGLADPRATRRCDHRLIDILLIAVCAVIACAESWEDIALYGHSKQAWLKSFLALPNDIPSHDTFRRVFMLIDPDAFEAGFVRWAQSLMGKVEREVVAIDGKTVRRSGSRRHDHGPLHLVSAWASDQLAVETIRGVHGTGKTEAEIRYFLTSCGDDPAVLVRAIRRHWSIENALHWVLDVTFR